MTTKQEGSKFQVELRGMKLPDELEERIGFEIRELVMRHVATIDFEGDLRIGPGLRILPDWRGLWLELRGGIKSIAGKEVRR